jgi:lipopolysaccharide transport system ATP-binding protein
MSEIAIRVENLGKQYQIGLAPERYPTLRDSLARVASAPLRLLRGGQQRKPAPLALPDEATDDTPAGTIWALREVSFDVKQGQVLGVIGRNGAGKSTLLKILSRVTDPTEGYAEIRGRVGSLLEVGTGFHPELTGRENIYLNGAILGMRRSEIARKFDEIVAFSEVEKFIDTPVKRYSSGMYLRLAFAVAAHLEPEILVVDEVLAVGDAEFQRKCLGKMSDVAQQGRTVLFVSHNMSAILRLTQETLVLDKGRLLMRAPTPQAVDHYLASGYAEVGERLWHAEEIPAEAAPFTPRALRVRDPAGRVKDTLRSVDPITVEVEYRLAAPLTGLRVGVYLMTTRGEYVFTSFDTDQPELYERFRTRPAGEYVSRFTIPGDFLNEGRYVMGLNASSYRVRRYFQDEQALTFTIDAAGAPGMQWIEPRLGPVRPRLAWQIENGAVVREARPA